MSSLRMISSPNPFFARVGGGAVRGIQASSLGLRIRQISYNRSLGGKHLPDF
jgi:hypothetical protein